MRAFAAFAVLALLALSGCAGWPRSDAKAVVYNETDAPVAVHVVVRDDGGRMVFEDTIDAGPQSRTEGRSFRLSGTYAVQATAGPLSANETVQLGSTTTALKVYVREGHIQVGAGSP